MDTKSNIINIALFLEFKQFV